MVYWGDLLKELWAITSIHYLCVNFPTEHGIATIRRDLMGSRECYLNSLRKFEPRNVNIIITDIEADNMDVEMDDVLEQWHTPEQEKDVEMIEAPKEGLSLDERNSWIFLFEALTAPIKELESFYINFQDPSQILLIEKALSLTIKEKLMNFL